MDDYTIKRLALVLAVQAEIEGMKAENALAKWSNEKPVHCEEAFLKKANRLSDIAHAHNEQL